MQQQHNNYDDEIDLLEVIGVFWRYRVLILSITIIFSLLASGYLLLNNSKQDATKGPVFHYKAMANLYFPTSKESRTSLGPAASRLVRSNKIFEELVQELKIFDFPNIQKALEQDSSAIKKRQIYEQIFKSKLNKNSEVLDLEFLHPSNKVALNSLKKVIDLTVKEFDKFKVDQSYYVLQEPFISGGEVIQYGKASKKLLYITLVFILSFIFSFSFALFLNFISKIKNNPEALKKLKGNRKN